MRSHRLMVLLVASGAILVLGLAAFAWTLGLGSSEAQRDALGNRGQAGEWDKAYSAALDDDIASYDVTSGCDGSAPGMANPAAVYCRQLGYEYRIVDTDEGQYGICIFPSGGECNEWRFLQGKCGQSHSYCARQGYGLITKTDGKNPFSREYSVCVHDQEHIGSATELMGLSEKATRGAFPVEQSPSPPEGGVSAVGAPSSFDWRNESEQDWMTSVKNQGSCGSCWAFSAVGVVEAVFNIGTGNPDLDLNLSEEYLVSDCLLDETCCGGWMDTAFTFIRDSGIPDEGCLPYVDGSPGFDGSACNCSVWDPITQKYVCDSSKCSYATPGKCSDRTCSDTCWDWQSRLLTIDDTGGVSSSQSAIKQAVVDKGPLSVAMGIGSYYGGYFDGDDIYRCTNPNGSGINHGVIIAGYDAGYDDAGGYWIVKNSWGTGWPWPGAGGYFKVGYGECAIEDDPVSYAVPGAPPGQYELTMRVSPPGGGTTSPSVGDHWYDSDTSVDVSASTNSGFDFDRWFGDCSGTSPATSVYMDSNKTCTANFCHEGCLCYPSSDTPIAIPDPGTVSSSISVPDGFTIDDVNLTLDITHTWDADLDVYLISPQSTRVELFTDVGGSGSNFTSTTLDDECATPISSGSAPFTGCYQPEGSLSDFDGEDSSGVWTLELSDDYGVDAGTLQSWSLELCGEPDQDGDGFADAVEAYIGTDPLDACPDNPSHDAWPFDVNIDTWSGVLDVLLYKGHLQTPLGDPDYDPRLDLNADEWVNALDILLYKGHLQVQCTNP